MMGLRYFSVSLAGFECTAAPTLSCPHFILCTATSTASLLGGTQGYYYHHCLTSDTLLHFSGSQGHKNRLERRQGVISPLLSSHEPAKAGCAGCHSSSRLRGALRRVETLEPGAEAVLSTMNATKTDQAHDPTLTMLKGSSIAPLSLCYAWRPVS